MLDLDMEHIMMNNTGHKKIFPSSELTCEHLGAPNTTNASQFTGQEHAEKE